MSNLKIHWKFHVGRQFGDNKEEYDITKINDDELIDSKNSKEYFAEIYKDGTTCDISGHPR